MNKEELIKKLIYKMENSFKILNDELKGLRIGRASTYLLDPVLVEAYGSKVPISQLATVSTPDARSIIIQVWDKQLVKNVEKSIIEANLGLNPVSDDQTIRVPIPILTEERRKELIKIAHKYQEKCKVSIRHIRSEGMEIIKKAEQNSELSKDDAHLYSEDIQKLTNKYSNEVDALIKVKEKDIIST